MTKIKRYGIMIPCVCLLLAILIAASIFAFFKITEGEVYEQDGLRQNTRVYMTDVYYVDHTVHFTTVNRTHESVSGMINSGNNNTYVVGYFNVTAEMLP